MAWEIKYLKSVEKNLRRISKRDRERIRQYIEHRVSRLDNPRQLGKSLRGKFLEFWRYRVGPYRIICKIDESKITLLVVRIAHRKEVYRTGIDRCVSKYS